MAAASKREFPSVEVQGIAIAAVGLREAVEQVLQWARRGQGGCFSFTGAHGIVEARRDEALRAALRATSANFADGMPVVWSGRRRGGDAASRMDRVYGPDFMAAMFTCGSRDGLRHYLCGGGEGVADRLARHLREAHGDDVDIAATFTPPFRPLTSDERRDLITDIDASGATLVWIGLSTPKQEKLMVDLAADLPGRLLFGVGAAFDVHAGRVNSAPPAVQDVGLEWAWRLSREPRRLLPRYARVVPAFLWGELVDRLRGR